MFWNEEDEAESVSLSTSFEVVFKMEGKTLPVKPLSAVARSLSEQISQWDDKQNISFHLMLGGEEGNGWYRDNDPESVLYLSRRTKLVFRVDEVDLDDIQALTGIALNVQGHIIKLTHKHNKKLQHSATLYSQHVVSEFEDEMAFLENVQQELRALDINCKKILCGKSRDMELLNRKVITRSLMLNELKKEDSLLLQTRGLGSEQKCGCGVFVPYKSIS